jgi:micrococcal nuclease
MLFQRLSISAGGKRCAIVKSGRTYALGTPPSLAAGRQDAGVPGVLRKSYQVSEESAKYTLRYFTASGMIPASACDSHTVAARAARHEIMQKEPLMDSHTDIRVQSKLYYYAADVTDVYDGDTITVNLDLGLGIWRNGVTVRFWKVDTPEVKGPERDKGLQVRDMVRELILHKSVLLRTILDKRGEDRTGKFGRLLGEILVTNERGALINVNDLLLGLGLAQPMDEGGSHVAATPRAATAESQSAPTSITCPFCGETRQVRQESTPAEDDAGQPPALLLIEQCPNCLDPARPLSDFQ